MDVEKNLLNSGSAENDFIDNDWSGFTFEDIKGWQKMSCYSCMIHWVEPPNPVRMNMICTKCGGIAHNEGVF